MLRLIPSLLAATISMTILGCSAANAQQFSGPHLDVLAGWSSGKGDDRFPVEGASPDGFVYGAGLGYDVRHGDALLGVMVEVSDVTGSDCRLVDSPAQGATLPAVRGSACGREGRTLVGGLRAGYVAGVDTLLYVTAGYANKRVAGSFVGAVDGNPVKYADKRNLDGIRAGAGIERALGQRLSLKAEYRYTAVGHDLALDQHQLVAGVGFHF